MYLIMNYHTAKAYILNELEANLAPELTYHSLDHTIDVLEVCKELCVAEGVSAYEQLLVQTAALFHDSGFLYTRKDHEEESCKIASKVLPDHVYSAEEIELICGMIRATKIPQRPYNHLEEIICDADLDYLGRSDFYEIGASLYEEMTNYQLIQNEKDWDAIQIGFLEKHSYLTRTNQERRTEKKLAHLEELKSKWANIED